MHKLKKKTQSSRLLILGLSIVFYALSFRPVCFAKELSFEVTVDTNKVSLGSSMQLSLSFNNAQDMPVPELPAIDGFQVF